MTFTRNCESQCPIPPNARSAVGLPSNGSLSDEQFGAFLLACRDELATKQAEFQQCLRPGDDWSYDMATCTLTIRDVTFPMTPIGTFSPVRQTWLWAWANRSTPPAAAEASKRIQSLFDFTGFSVFIEQGIDASSSDAQDLAALAVHQLEAIGFFLAPVEGGPIRFLAVHHPTSANSSAPP
jgi:hypothetical protein